MEYKAMNRPAVAKLAEKVDGCRYMLVTVVSKRARQITQEEFDKHAKFVAERSTDRNGNSAPAFLNKNEVKPVAKAIDELWNDELDIEYPPEFSQNKI